VILVVGWSPTRVPAVRLPLDPGRWRLPFVPCCSRPHAVLHQLHHGLLASGRRAPTAIMELHAGVSLFLAGRIAPLALLAAGGAGVAEPCGFVRCSAFRWTS